MRNPFKNSFLLIPLVFVFSSCTWDQLKPQIDCTISPIQAKLEEVINSECNSANGRFEISTFGGSAPYKFATEFEINDDGIFDNVKAGNYQVDIIDVNNCSTSLEVSVDNTDGVNLDNVVVSETGCGSSTGSIQIVASGGAEPLTYKLNGVNDQSSNTFLNLDRGTYSVSVVDQNGCSVTESIKVKTNVSYSASIKSIIETSCAISNCHNGNVSPDLRSFSTIQSRANAIKSRTSSGSMPKGSTLSTSQIEMIACWVDDGAPQN